MHYFNQTVKKSGRIENLKGAAGVGQLHSQVKIFKYRKLFCPPANGFESAARDDHGTGAAPKVPVFPTVTVWSMQLESGRARAGDARVKLIRKRRMAAPSGYLGNRKVAACGYLANMRLPPNPFMPTLYVVGTAAVTCDEYALWTPPEFTDVTT